MIKRRVWIFWILSAVLILLTGLKDSWAFSGFQRSLNDRPWGIVESDRLVRSGRTAQLFELRPGDCGSQPGWSDCLTDRERVEMSQLKPYLDLDRTYWVSWSLWLDPAWPDISPVTTTLGQFHHRDSSVPALLFVQRNGQYSLRIESAKSLYVGRDTYPLKSLDRMRGSWTDVVVQVRFSNKDQGMIRVWVDGRLVAAVNGVSTLGTTPVYFKYGIYRSFVSRRPDRTVHRAAWDEVRLGTTRQSVDPRINPGLSPVN